MPERTSQTELNELLYSHLIAGAVDHAIFFIDPGGTIATWNTGVRRMLGYEEHEFVGLPFGAIFTEADQLSGADTAELERAKSAGCSEDERWHCTRDSRTIWASGALSAVREPDGSLRGFVKIMRDQTQRKEFEQQLVRQSNLLADANRELRNFAGIISHDLNTPLQTVYGFAHLLESELTDIDDERVDRCLLRYIVESTERMIGLVRRMLEYASTAERMLKHETVDMGQVAADVVADLRFRIEKTGGSVSVGELPIVYGDRVLIRRVMQNLVDNALKFGRPGTKPLVSIAASRGDGETIVAIEDNGRGIPFTLRRRLFTLYDRLAANSTDEGTGIGLATCSRIVERWGGVMGVRSAEGVGSTFSFSIPDVDQDASSAPTVLGQPIMVTQEEVSAKSPRYEQRVG